jgi:hypothetical protein
VALAGSATVPSKRVALIGSRTTSCVVPSGPVSVAWTSPIERLSVAVAASVTVPPLAGSARGVTATSETAGFSSNCGAASTVTSPA